MELYEEIMFSVLHYTLDAEACKTIANMKIDAQKTVESQYYKALKKSRQLLKMIALIIHIALKKLRRLSIYLKK